MDDRYLERIDPLTRGGNLLAFLETLSGYIAKTPAEVPFSLLLIDLNKFSEFNAKHGSAQGDRVLHWVSIVLRDTELPVYRISGDEFLVLFTDGSLEKREGIARAIFDRLKLEGSQFEMPNPASVILIHFQSEKLEVADIWIAIGDAMFDVKVYENRGFLVNKYSHASAGNIYQIRLINMLTERLLSFADILDTTHQLAYIDPISQLPNSLAAEREMEHAIEKGGAFTILFIDGDNLRLYNTINYSEGDQMIKNLSDVLSDNLRPGDFLARWRVGDEFLVILPATVNRKAIAVAERLRAAVEAKSITWQFPITISVGLASFPKKGRTSKELLQAAEDAAKLAKEKGKNQVCTL